MAWSLNQMLKLNNGLGAKWCAMKNQEDTKIYLSAHYKTVLEYTIDQSRQLIWDQLFLFIFNTLME